MSAEWRYLGSLAPAAFVPGGLTIRQLTSEWRCLVSLTHAVFVPDGLTIREFQTLHYLAFVECVDTSPLVGLGF